MKNIEDQIREICTYHSDGGTSGYNLSEEQFQKLFNLLASQGKTIRQERDMFWFNMRTNLGDQQFLELMTKMHRDIVKSKYLSEQKEEVSQER